MNRNERNNKVEYRQDNSQNLRNNQGLQHSDRLGSNLGKFSFKSRQ